MHKLHQNPGPVICKAKDIFRRVNEAVFPDVPFASGLMPVMAGVPSSFLQPVLNQEPRVPSSMRFSTNELPGRRTPSRDIMGGASIDIAESTTFGKAKDVPGRSISYKAAQQEVARILGGQASCHEYIAYEAAKMCGNNPLIARYTLHIMVGAAAEDFVFAHGEKFEDLYVKTPEHQVRSREEFVETGPIGREDTPAFFRGVLTIFSKIRAAFKRRAETDALNRPYFAHFFDPSRQAGDQGLSLMHGDIKFQSSKDRVKAYWNIASRHYLDNDMPNAFCALGHMVHLISDMQVPAHVHNDIHGPNVVLGKPDSLEDWLARADYPHIARKTGKPNVRIWSSRQLQPPQPNPWTFKNLDADLGLFIAKVVADAQKFRSVDVKGSGPGQNKTGPLTPDECFDQASHLIPGAMKYSAQIILNFVDYHRRSGVAHTPAVRKP